MLIFLGCILSLATPSANEPWRCFSSCIGSNNNEWTVRWQEEGEEGQGSAAWRSSQAHALKPPQIKWAKKFGVYVFPPN